MSLWDGDLGRFSLFGKWISGEDGSYGRGDEGGGCGVSWVFCLFQVWLLAEYDGWESGDKGCG